jgi:acyl-CoA reductase-like NAD-dependent aldehyde dehydrogenase
VPPAFEDRVEAAERSINMAMASRSSHATAMRHANLPPRVNVGMIGINVPIPVPVAYHTFGGWKRSAFGDTIINMAWKA